MAGLYAISLWSLAPQGGSGVTGLAPGLPVRLQIPAINVDATIEHVGLTASGDLSVPTQPADVGWFEKGPRPGEKGSAVIDGHEGWKDSLPAAFDNLYKLRKGDKVYVTDASGATRTFVVRATQTFGQAASVPELFASSGGKVQLNLITCEGTWSTATQSYSGRLAVFTDEQ